MADVADRRDLDWLRIEMDELFSGLARQGRRVSRAGFRPPADVYRTEDPAQVVVTVDLAGVDPSEIALAFADGVLIVSGLRRRPPAEAAVYQQMEIDYGPFERRVPIGDDVDPPAADATYDRGFLTVRLPIVARPRPPSGCGSRS